MCLQLPLARPSAPCCTGHAPKGLGGSALQDLNLSIRVNHFAMYLLAGIRTRRSYPTQTTLSESLTYLSARLRVYYHLLSALLGEQMARFKPTEAHIGPPVSNVHRGDVKQAACNALGNSDALCLPCKQLRYRTATHTQLLSVRTASLRYAICVLHSKREARVPKTAPTVYLSVPHTIACYRHSVSDQPKKSNGLGIACA